MSVVTRFAPSPTGYLHIGGARTALFNWLFARRLGGKYLLRIEDTDRARSTPQAVDAIHDGLDWLSLQGDGQTVYQFQRANLHRATAMEMVERGTAFRCYATPDEVETFRKNVEKSRPKLKALRDRIAHQTDFSGLTWDDLADLTWDDLDISWDEMDDKAAVLDLISRVLNQGYRSPYREGKLPPSPGAPYVVRLRAPDEGDIINPDLVQGDVRIKAREIDDLVLLRADGNPTYMLSVVVDDHDMGVTHIIRGDDHLTNAARQIPIYRAMGWDAPKFAHIPLIHGQDGAKLSKRHGAPEVGTYRDMGYLPEAMNAYLMRLGWSPGHDDILTKEEAVASFDLAHVGKAPARLDLVKLDSVNAHFMKLADDARLTELLWQHLAAKGQAPSPIGRARVEKAVPVLKTRAKTIAELADQARFLLSERPLTLDAAAQKTKDESRDNLRRLRDKLADQADWTAAALAEALKAFAAETGIGMGKFGPGLRAVLTGGAPAPDLGNALEFLGKEESLARLSDQI